MADLATMAFWASAMGLFVLGVLFLVFAFYTKTGKRMGKVPRWIGYALIILSIVSYLGIYTFPVDDATIVPSATYDVTCAEAEAEISVNTATHTINWAITYNTTANAFTNSSGAGTLNFTVAWVSGEAGAVSCAIGAVPMVDISGSADIALVDENADETYNALWTKYNVAETALVTAYENINLYVEVADSEWASCVITLEATSLAGMAAADEMDSYDLPMIIAGESWNIHFVLVDVTA